MDLAYYTHLEKSALMLVYILYHSQDSSPIVVFQESFAAKNLSLVQRGDESRDPGETNKRNE